MLKVGVVGARGYTGEELIKILLRHPQVRLTYLAATLEKSVPIKEIFPFIAGLTDLACEPFSADNAIARCDLVFLALPHTVSMDVAPAFIKAGKAVIDLSADYRIKNAGTYETWYHKQHKDTVNLKKFVYGLPELYREKIKKTRYVANPGCYPTAAIVGIVPSLIAGIADPQRIIIDAKSGVSGAGRKVVADYLFCEVNENFRGYKHNAHQHAPEIDQELSRVAVARIKTLFCPHLLPISRGIYETIYVSMKKSLTADKVEDVYQKFYKKEPFVRVRGLGVLPQVKDVNGTNFCDIGLVVDEARKVVIVSVVIDNLLKGASGQAVQNMNIMCGFDEKTGLV